MLLELSITDFAIIERATIQFSEGLNALTGETGAGKSILLDALGAVLGSRVSSDLVRTGCALARVEAAFALDEAASGRLKPQLDVIGVELDVDGSLILSREVQANGRSTARVNGRLSTAGALGSIGMSLVDIHGQSDHLAILKTTEQRHLLDRFGALDHQRTTLSGIVREWRDARARLADVVRGSREREQRIDLLRFQIDEIDAAAVGIGDDDVLAGERDILRNADRLRGHALEALSALVDDDIANGADITSLVRRVTSLTTAIASYDSTSGELDSRANELLVLAEDLARQLRTYAERIESNESRLAEVEDRLSTIQSLKRKYGATLLDVLDFAERARRELADLTSGELDLGALQVRESTLGTHVASLSIALSDDRKLAAKQLSAAVEQSIADLYMGRAEIMIAVNHREDATGIALPGTSIDASFHIDESGIDEIEFLIAPNAGEALKPLARSASGGETARLMLAVKSILSDVDLTPTLVFDEIDVGVGGRSGQVVGEKLWGISQRHQVIVVTHLPQVAALADTHLKIEKREVDRRTVSDVRVLTGTDRELEVAAMIDGLPPGEAARLNAKTMLDRSRAFVASSR
ncbi:MAG: DNA repair protein RecN [Thermomicrobiales bacterium]